MSCPECFSGTIHAGNPRGEVTKLHGLDVYVAKPPGDIPHQGIVIIVPDAFGWEVINNRLLADNYAEKGKYLVYLPEFMGGHAPPPYLIPIMKKFFKNESIMDWIWKPYYIALALYAIAPFKYYNTFKSSYPIVKAFFKSVREDTPAETPLYGAGFCWGGKHVVNLAGDIQNGKPLINAGFTGHPSALDIPHEIEHIKLPVSFALGEKDVNIKPPMIELLREAVEKEGRGEVKVYPDAGHGFCVRADLVLDDASKQAAEAEDQAITWFQRYS